MTSENFPLIYVNELTVGKLQHDLKRVRLLTPLGWHLMMKYVEKEAECSDGSLECRKRASDDSDVILEAKKKRSAVMLERI